eukprot:Em0003g756a
MDVVSTNMDIDVTMGRAACAAVIIALIIRKRQRRRRKRSTWVREWIRRRHKYGAYHHLMRELQALDVSSYLNFVRMNASTFETLLTKTNKEPASRCPFPKKLFVVVVVVFFFLRKADPEKKKASVRDTYKADPEKKEGLCTRHLHGRPRKEEGLCTRSDTYKADPEKKKAYVRDTYKADPEKKKASVRDTYNANAVSKRAAKRQRYQEGVEENRAAKRQRYQEGVEENRAAKRQRYREGLEENRAAKRRIYRGNSATIKAARRSRYWKGRRTTTTTQSYSLFEPNSHTLAEYGVKLEKAILRDTLASGNIEELIPFMGMRDNLSDLFSEDGVEHAVVSEDHSSSGLGCIERDLKVTHADLIAELHHPEKKKASVRDSYKADPEKKKASVRDSYNADIESKQSAKGSDIKRTSRRTALLKGRNTRTIQMPLRHLKGIGIGMTPLSDWLNVLPRGSGFAWVTELPLPPKAQKVVTRSACAAVSKIGADTLVSKALSVRRAKAGSLLNTIQEVNALKLEENDILVRYGYHTAGSLPPWRLDAVLPPLSSATSSSSSAAPTPTTSSSRATPTTSSRELPPPPAAAELPERKRYRRGHRTTTTTQSSSAPTSSSSRAAPTATSSSSRAAATSRGRSIATCTSPTTGTSSIDTSAPTTTSPAAPLAAATTTHMAPMARTRPPRP